MKTVLRLDALHEFLRLEAAGGIVLGVLSGLILSAAIGAAVLQVAGREPDCGPGAQLEAANAGGS